MAEHAHSGAGPASTPPIGPQRSPAGRLRRIRAASITAHLLAIEALGELAPNAGIDVPGEGQFVLAGGVELPGVDVLLQKFLRQILDGEATGRASRARGHERAHPSLDLLEQSGGLRTRLRDRDRRIAAEIHPVLAAQEELPARLGPALAGHRDEQRPARGSFRADTHGQSRDGAILVQTIFSVESITCRLAWTAIETPRQGLRRFGT